jgi:predicted dehydrogenase
MGKYRIAAVGLGPRAGSLLEIVVSHPDVQIAGLCDACTTAGTAPAQLIERLAARGIKPAVHDDYGNLLAARPDCVMVLTPPPLHASMAVRALEAGCDVISEVPAAWTLEEARDLVRAVRRTGRRYFFAENCLYWGFVEAWVKMARDGRIGAVSYAEGEYIHDLGELLHRNVAGGPDARYASWRASMDPIRYCTHETGPLLTILDTRVTSATAFSTPSHVRPDLPSGADLQMAVFETASGAICKELCGFSVTRHPPLHYYVVYGSKTTLETDREDLSTLASFTDLPNLTGLSRLPLSYASTRPAPAWAKTGHGGADGMMIVDFLDSLLSGSVPPIDVFRGLDFSLPGICSVESIRQGNRKIVVPDPREW